MTSERESTGDGRNGERRNRDGRDGNGGGREVTVATNSRGGRRGEVRADDATGDDVTVDGEIRRYEVSDGESPSEAVTYAVTDGGSDDRRSDDGGPALTDQRPLYEVVDPDALDSLFENRSGFGTAIGCVRFTYEGHDVTVRADGEVLVRPADG